MPKFSEKEIARNMQFVDAAIAQQELEGLTVDADTIADLRSAASGEIDEEEVDRRIQRRYQHGPVFAE